MKLKKILAVTLALTLLVSAASFGMYSRAETLTECNGDCGYAPGIVIPGIFQSDTFMLDENGEMVTDSNGKPLTQLMVDLGTMDIVKIVFKAIVPLLLTLVLQRDMKLSDTVGALVADVLSGNAKDNDGNHINNIGVVKYKKSLAACSEKEKNDIYNTIPLKGYSDIAGEDHLYFFAYNSFDSIEALADELYEFIQQVKQETGHSKINIAPISQGGTIANMLFEKYPQVADDLNRVVYIVPALDGSMLVGEIVSGNFIKDDDMLYARLFPMLVGEDNWMSYFINIALRALPKNVTFAIIDKTVESLLQTVILNCTALWALVPQRYYPALAEKYLSGSDRQKIKAETERYYQAQVNSRANILKMQADGVKFFNIVDYDFLLYPLFSGWDTVNGDGVIHLDSSSIGAVSGAVGEKLPEGYVEKGTYCDCGGSHISPDGIVDASAGVLCETSFYFKGQDHEGTGRNDVIMRLAIELLSDENFTSVHSYPDAYPQFNVGRESKGLRNSLPWIKDIDQSALSDEDKAELNAAIEQCEAMLAKTVVVPGEFEAANARLNAILIKIGARNAPSEPSAAMDILTFLMKFFSDSAYKVVGPRGFSDIFRFW
ncbi:MAG: alpha/beta hydrolase [Oscillospiraceae bacterium]|nr:alpha/beta hydrolase [Oscillospiraceae bacterium]